MWWQLSNVDDRSAMVVTDSLIEKVTNIAVPKLELLKRAVYVVLSLRISGWGQEIDVGETICW